MGLNPMQNDKGLVDWKLVMFVSGIGMILGATLLQLWAAGQSGESDRSFIPRPAVLGQPIAGIPFDEAVKIHERNAAKLRELPGVIGVAISGDGLIVETADPSVLPAAVKGLPVIPVPPVDPRAAGGIIGATSIPVPSPVEPAPLPPPTDHPHEERPCPPDATRQVPEGRCQYASSLPQPDKLESKFLPPPSGVIVLRPNKVRDHADSCPDQFREVEESNGWRFCLAPGTTEIDIPPLWVPPIAGVPYEEALEIHYRHVDELSKLPGVTGVGLHKDGIHVATTNPAVVPSHVEGLPITVEPPNGEKRTMGHTSSQAVRPLRGALNIGDITISSGSLTGIALSDGHPWLIFPAHLVNNCSSPSPCALNGTPLNQCLHYTSPGQSIMVQPPGGTSPTIGYVQRRTPIIPGSSTKDVAAAYMDSDLVEGNGSLAATRTVEKDTTATSFSGSIANPVVGQQVKMRSWIGPPHELQLVVTSVGVTDLVHSDCANGNVSHTNQVHYTVTTVPLTTFERGDSGSPIFNSTEALVGMLNWCVVNSSGLCIDEGGGTTASDIQSILKFDKFYGENTVQDQSIAVFRPSTGTWYVDNGNGRWDGSCSVSGGTGW